MQTITLLPTRCRPLALSDYMVGTETCFAHRQQLLLVSQVQSVKHWHWPVASVSTVNVVFSVDVSRRIKFYLLLGQRIVSVSDGEEFVDVRYVSMGTKWTFVSGESMLCLVHLGFLVVIEESRTWGLSAGTRGLPGAMKKGYETKMNLNMLKCLLNGTLSHSPWKTTYKIKI